MTPEEARALVEQRRTGVSPAQPASSGPLSPDAARRLVEQRRAQREGQPQTPTLLQHLGQQVTKPLGALRDAAVGPRDPAEAETPMFTGNALPNAQRAAVQRGKAVTFDDDAYADVVRSQLGNRFISMERDANNYPIITYIGEDGQQRREYLNRPGLDTQDVDRALSSSVPFMAGAGVANFGLRALGTGASLIPRVGAQFLAGTTASIGSDVAASSMGSEQGVDLGRAATAGAFQGVFEGLSGPMARTWSAIFRRYPLNRDGTLTPEAIETARRAGLNPDEMSERVRQAYARDLARGSSPEEIGAKFRSGEFGIPTTLGQRTGLPDQLGREEEMRRGLMGPEVQGVMRDFDQRQRDAIGTAVRETVPGRVAPGASSLSTRDLGDNIRSGARGAREALETQEGDLWSKVGEMFPQDGAFGTLPGSLQTRVNNAGIRPDAELTPAAHRMLQDLEGYARGDVTQSQYALLPDDVRRLDVDSMRRRLLDTYRAASPGSPDAKAARAIYDGFNDWIDEAAELAMLSGSPDSAAALRAARGFTREVKSLFQPTQGGRMTPAARRISGIMDDADSGEGVIRSLFGSAGPRSTPPEGAVQTIQNMREILVRGGQERAWDDIRMAYWLRIAMDPQGKPLSPGMLRNNIDRAFANQSTLMDTMFTATEQAYMTRLARALDDVVYIPPNPSGTSYELMRMQRQQDREPIIKTMLSTQAKRELFSKGNVLMSRIYSSLARRIPNVAGARDATAMPLARQATTQEVQRRSPRAWFIAPTGGFAGAISTSDEEAR